MLRIILFLLLALAPLAAQEYPRRHGFAVMKSSAPEYLVIREADAWRKLQPRLKCKQPMPRVNFSRSMVIITLSDWETWLNAEPCGDSYMVAVRPGTRRGGFFDLLVVGRRKGGAEFNLR
ncbi:MAG: hypothetical protein FJX76_24080 [Armatimonadetes bacterium]|nr:hypothetical protein [Armatimonadota bacterium]